MGDSRAVALRRLLSLIEVVLPEVVLIENVPGVTTKPASSRTPCATNVIRRALQRTNRVRGTRYELQVFRLDAADFGVPQHRVRTFMVASREGIHFEPPRATHAHGGGTEIAAYLTAWDAIGSLKTDDEDPTLSVGGKWAGLLPSVPEGANYLFHTPRGGGEPLFGWRTRYWSFLLKLAKNQPSWTIQASPGSATGPFHWKNRRLSVQEMARLQTFPDDYQFVGSFRAAQRQIGNAVPAAVGEMLGIEIRRQILGDASPGSGVTLVPTPERDCPCPEDISRVPRQYLRNRGPHSDHPGAGLGPSASIRELLP
jgi:DNA (cytosine-5)-methyltransferase 1